MPALIDNLTAYLVFYCLSLFLMISLMHIQASYSSAITILNKRAEQLAATERSDFAWLAYDLYAKKVLGIGSVAPKFKHLL